MMPRTENDYTEKVRELNDQFRTTLVGGKIWATRGIQSLPEKDQAAILDQVRTFDEFNEDNDPHGEHDFGSFSHNGLKIFFKIDYYDLNLEGHSEDASDPTQTKRVLTIMLATEY